MPEEETTPTSYSWKRDPLFWAYSILMFLPIIMVFVFYNYYRLDFLVYAGWILLVFSVFIIFLAGGEFRKKGGAPKGKSIVHTTVVVDSGIYAVVRHPQYFGFILFVLALVLMSQHWLSVFSGVMGSALFYKDVLREEQMSTKKFGDEYKRYMKKVPRMNFFLGILRLLRRRRKQSQEENSNSTRDKDVEQKAGLGSEHPLCDSLQLAMLMLYFAVWGIDSLSHFLFRVSTVMIELTSFPLLLLPAFLSLSFGIYLALKSHDAVFGETTGQSQLIDSGVYSWVRHPMYLGTLMFCLGFFFAISSLLSLGVWIVFFIIYDRMATYEEKDLIRILGEKYIAYQRRVRKWSPRPKENPKNT